MQDIHSHVLPGIDDGARNLEEAKALLFQLADEGVTRQVLTPHFYTERESLESFLRRREAAWQALLTLPGMQGHVSDSGKPWASYDTDGLRHAMRIELAAEVAYSSKMFSYPNLDSLCFGDEPYLLLEMPFTKHWDSHLLQRIEHLELGYDCQLVIAHVERYPATDYGRDTDVLGELREIGCLLQMNATSLFEKRTKRVALKLLQGGWIDRLASDCHDLVKRPPRLAEARSYLQKKLHMDIEEQHLADL